MGGNGMSNLVSTVERLQALGIGVAIREGKPFLLRPPEMMEEAYRLHLEELMPNIRKHRESIIEYYSGESTVTVTFDRVPEVIYKDTPYKIQREILLRFAFRLREEHGGRLSWFSVYDRRTGWLVDAELVPDQATRVTLTVPAWPGAEWSWELPWSTPPAKWKYGVEFKPPKGWRAPPFWVPPKERRERYNPWDTRKELVTKDAELPD
jgi:hypothetical protein